LKQIKSWLLGLSALVMGLLAFFWKRAEKKALLAKTEHLRAEGKKLEDTVSKKKKELITLEAKVKKSKLKGWTISSSL